MPNTFYLYVALTVCCFEEKENNNFLSDAEKLTRTIDDLKAKLEATTKKVSMIKSDTIKSKG